MRKECSDMPYRTLGGMKGFGIYSAFSAGPWVGLKLESDGKWFRTLDSCFGSCVDERLW